jgi:aminopeptidase-like protein
MEDNMALLEDEIESYFDRLFPINRSITGKGFQDSLDIIREIIPLEKINFNSGEQCFDWTIPDEWNINDAYIITPDGKKIAEFKVNNLHVVGYSVPIDKEINLDELREHLHTIEDTPHAIPYVTSIYSRTWGFCLTHDEYSSLKEGMYRVYVDSEIKPGKLTIGMLTLPGKSDKEILISTYLCHPSMAVNELSGPLVTAFLYKKLKKCQQLEHTVRFVFVPENIGSIAFLSKYGENLKKNIVAGYVINCVGHGDCYTYKRSRIGNTISDRSAINILKNKNIDFKVVEFFPNGSDERQYCSPGFNLPMGLIMRPMFGTFKEYHTSLDDKNYISFEVMKECIDTYYDTIMTIDNNQTYISTILYGTPQLGKYALYNPIMDGHSLISRQKRNTLLDIVNFSDGEHDLLNIAEIAKVRMLDLLDELDMLLKAGILIKK